MNGVLGVCGTGIVSCVGGTSALKAEIPDAKGTDQVLPLARLSLLVVAVLAICQAGVVFNTGIASVLCMVGIVLLLLFFKQDADSENRIFPRGILNPGTVSGSGLLMISSLFMATISLTVYGPLLMYIIFGADPLIAGYIIALEPLGWTIVALVHSVSESTLNRA